jgi:hypothetical protein
MTEEQEKAIYLIGLFIGCGNDNNIEVARKCAINCVKQIIEACEYNNVEVYNTNWWNKVIEEIKNI